MNATLMEIKEEHLETGLRGVPVGYCTTSTVNPQDGLFYRGIAVKEMAEWRAERVIYLLYHGFEGDEAQVAAFSAELQERSCCQPETIAFIRQLPRQGHPMKLFAAALLICGMVEGCPDWREACLQIIAKAPQLAATVINHHAGWPDIVSSKPHLGYIENFVQMMNKPQGVSAELKEILRTFNILHFDHGGGNLSAFVGKAIASGLEDMYGALSGAMCALAGPRHGRANQDSLEFVQSIKDELGDDLSEERVKAAVRRRLEQGELIFGYGHAVLRVEDPRATLLFALAERYFPQNSLVRVAQQLRRCVPEILMENPKISNPYPNVDAISGVLLSAAGFPYPEYFTVLFGMARVVGISLQIVYERCEARGGKGTPIIRPKYIYKASETP